MTKYKNIKSTCNKKTCLKVKPEPAEVVAGIVGVSESYVKKIRSGTREDHSEKADAVKYCDEMIVEGKKVLLKEVQKIINKKQHKPSKKSKNEKSN